MAGKLGPGAFFGQLPIQWRIDGSPELPARRPLLRFVGESHDVPHGLLVEVATCRDLLIDLESERRVGVADLRSNPLWVPAGDRREGRPCTPQRVWRDRRQCAQTGLCPLGVGSIDGAAQNPVAETIWVTPPAAVGAEEEVAFAARKAAPLSIHG